MSERIRSHPDATVEVWWSPTDLSESVLGDCEDLLDDAERERARAFRHPRHGAQYRVAHAMLRDRLSRALDQAPAAIRFRTGEHGKPLPDDEWSHRGIAFNLAHADGVALVAAGPVAALGVDAEPRRRKLDWGPLARRYFSGAEQAALAAIPPGDRDRAFLACWVRKEAVVKAHGAGIALGLDSFDVNVDPDEAPRLLATRGPRWAGETYRLAAIEASPDHVCALAVAGPPPRVVVRRWTPPRAPAGDGPG